MNRQQRLLLASLKYLRDTYGVPVFLDYPVTWRGEVGVISGTSGPRVEVTLKSGRKVGPIHPTDEDLNYGEDFCVDCGAVWGTCEHYARHLERNGAPHV